MTKPKHIRAGLYAMYYEHLSDIAKEYGYNLVVHGSMNRDLDLIAIAWTENARNQDEMIFEFQEYLTGLRTSLPNGKPPYSNKPHGRKCISIDLNRGDKHGEWVRFEDKQYYLDLSIIPINNTLNEIKHTSSLPLLSQFRNRRNKLGLSMDNVSAEIGVSKSTISRLENGKDVFFSHVKLIHEFYNMFENKK